MTHYFFFLAICLKHYCFITDFSLSLWLNNRQLTIDSAIDDVTSNDLIAELGLSDYMGFTDKCNLNSPPFSSATDGWVNGLYNIL